MTIFILLAILAISIIVAAKYSLLANKTYSSQHSVDELNRVLQKMDSASTVTSLEYAFKEAVDMITALPDGIHLNGMSKQQAIFHVGSEHDRILKERFGGTVAHTIQKDFGKAELYGDGRVQVDFTPNVAVGNVKKQMKIHIDTTADNIQKGMARHEAEKQRLLDKYGSGDVIDIGDGMVRVKRDYLTGRYIRGAIISDDLLFADEDDAGYVTIKRQVLSEMEARLSAYNNKHGNP